jgi:hypothetical protein
VIFKSIHPANNQNVPTAHVPSTMVVVLIVVIPPLTAMLNASALTAKQRSTRVRCAWTRARWLVMITSSLVHLASASPGCGHVMELMIVEITVMRIRITAPLTHVHLQNSGVAMVAVSSRAGSVIMKMIVVMVLMNLIVTIPSVLKENILVVTPGVFLSTSFVMVLTTAKTKKAVTNPLKSAAKEMWHARTASYRAKPQPSVLNHSGYVTVTMTVAITVTKISWPVRLDSVHPTVSDVRIIDVYLAPGSVMERRIVLMVAMSQLKCVTQTNLLASKTCSNATMVTVSQAFMFATVTMIAATILTKMMNDNVIVEHATQKQNSLVKPTKCGSEICVLRKIGCVMESRIVLTERMKAKKTDVIRSHNLVGLRRKSLDATMDAVFLNTSSVIMIMIVVMVLMKVRSVTRSTELVLPQSSLVRTLNVSRMNTNVTVKMTVGMVLTRCTVK